MEKMKLKSVFAPNGLCVHNNSIWFVHIRSNKVVNVDINSFEILDIITLPEESYNIRSSDDRIFCIEDKLIILIYGRPYIYTYDLRTKELKKISYLFDKYPMYSDAEVLLDNKLLFLPCWGNPLIEYNCANDQVDIKQTDGYEKQHMARCIEITDGYIYSVDRKSNTIYEYDIRNGIFKQINIGENIYSGIKKVKNYFVLPHKDGITLWRKDTNEIVELYDFPTDYRSERGNAFMDIYGFNNYAYIFPKHANMILEVDVDDKVIKRGFSDMNFNRYLDDSFQFKEGIYLDTVEYNSKIYACNSINGYWDIFDLKKQSVESKSCLEIKDAMNDIKCGDCLYESLHGYYDLGNYILYIKQSNETQKNKNNEIVGSNIYGVLNN